MRFRLPPSTLLVVALLGTSLPGCAFYYYDPETAAQHVFGLGHLAVKVTPPLEDAKAVMRQSTLTGLALGMDEGKLSVSLGIDRSERIVVVDENTSVRIEKPKSRNFFHIRIGTAPPESFWSSRDGDPLQ